ncbi:hypothetical protein Trydic_g5476 [Trypoxylus dichotomus]
MLHRFPYTDEELLLKIQHWLILLIQEQCSMCETHNQGPKEMYYLKGYYHYIFFSNFSNWPKIYQRPIHFCD